jgi:predicted amidohydrolase
MNKKPVIAALSIGINEKYFDIPMVGLGELENALDGIENRNLDLVLFPQYVIGKNDPNEKKKQDLLKSFAKERQCYVVFNYYKDNYSISEILDRNGNSFGEYKKTHKIEGIDSDICLGDNLPVFELDFAKVALLSGTDIYFPELSECYSLFGAEILLCSMGIEPLRDDTQIQRLLHSRAVMNFMFVVSATYASEKPMYMINNYDAMHGATLEDYDKIDHQDKFNSNGLGLLPGRACIYDLRGELLCNTGRDAGAVISSLPMAMKRESKKYIFGLGHPVWHQNERGVFDDLTKEFTFKKKSYAVKKPIITFAHMTYKDTIGAWGNETEKTLNYQKLFAYMREAAGYSDMVIFSELSAPTNEMTDDIKSKYSEIASENHCYILINQEIEQRNISVLFDRNGEQILSYEKVNGLCFMYDKIDKVGKELPVVELDFATIGVMVCADAYCQEIPRIYALKGAELVILQSQSWGFDSVHINEGFTRAFAIENGITVLMSNFPSSQVAHRTNIIDPSGETIFASGYDREGLYSVEVDVDAIINHESFIYKDGMVLRDFNFRERLMKARRPEFYEALTSKGFNKKT